MMLHGQGERSGTCSLSTIPFNFRECFGGLGVQSEFPEPQRLGQKFWKIYVECPRPHTQGIKCVYIYPSFWEKMWMLFQNIWNHAIFFSKYIFFTEMKIFPSQREICALWKGPETIFLFSLILNYLTFPFFCCNFALFFWAPPPPPLTLVGGPSQKPFPQQICHRWQRWATSSANHCPGCRPGPRRVHPGAHPRGRYTNLSRSEVGWAAFIASASHAVWSKYSGERGKRLAKPFCKRFAQPRERIFWCWLVSLGVKWCHVFCRILFLCYWACGGHLSKRTVSLLFFFCEMAQFFFSAIHCSVFPIFVTAGRWRTKAVQSFWLNTITISSSCFGPVDWVAVLVVEFEVAIFPPR